MNKIFLSLLLLLQGLLFSNESMQTVPAYWDGQYFYEASTAPHLRYISAVCGNTLFFNVGHITCYGHALLDGVFPLFVLIKQHQLMDKPFNLLISATQNEQHSATFNNIIELIKNLFKNSTILIIDANKQRYYPLYIQSLIVNQHTPFIQKANYTPSVYSLRFQITTPPKLVPHFSFYTAYPESFNYISYFQTQGLRDNLTFQDLNTTPNLVKEFVDFIQTTYHLHAPMIKNRVILALRKGSREILNQQELINTLALNGFDVHPIYFDKLSVREQILETMQAEYLIGIYGSNLVNAIFLPQEAHVVVLWHKYLKYFYSRKYCIIHSAFLSTGVTLIEYDKPEYDPRDQYMWCRSPEKLYDPDYFMQVGSMIQLKPEKESLEEILKATKLPDDIFNTHLYIDPQAVLAHLNP